MGWRNFCGRHKHELALVAILLAAKVLLIYEVHMSQPYIIAVIQSNNTTLGSDMPYTARLVNETDNPLFHGLCCHYDSEHYLSIAEGGYREDKLYAFAPGYPMLIKAASYTVGFKLAGLLVSNIFSLISAILFYRVASIYLDGPKTFSAAVLYSLFPFNLVFGTAAYSEPVFLTFALLSWLYFEKRRYSHTGVFMLLASSARYAGIFLYPITSLIYLLLAKNTAKNEKISTLLKLNTTAILPITWLLVYLPSLGVDLGEIQLTYWSAKISTPFVFYIGFLKTLDGLPAIIYGIPFALTYLVFITVNARGFRLHKSLSLYSLAFILLYSTLTGVSALAYPRYLGTVWPTYILLADYAENKVVLFTYVVISFTIAAVALTLHSSWIFVA